MSRPGWRIDLISDGRLAWLYVLPHAVQWSDVAAKVELRGYTITEERQNLVDDQMGACLRYLAVRVGGRQREPPLMSRGLDAAGVEE